MSIRPLLLTIALTCAIASPAHAGCDMGFPDAEPTPADAALGSLKRLHETIERLVADEEVVGAEMLIIKNGRSIFHRAYGWRDREAGARMEPGGVFCVRSMTKPLIGAAILMLIDDGRLALTDRAADHLPSFDADGTRDVTIGHLLQHTSGLPLSLILGEDLNALHEQGGIRAVADLGGGMELEFPPGTGFTYSDQGTDTLTAIMEAVTGQSPEAFITARLLQPLGMRDTACVMSVDHPLRARGVSKHVGQRGAWQRFWSPQDPPLFPFLLGSQGLYCTLEDYARFMRFWMDDGRCGDDSLLDPALVRAALTPSRFTPSFSTGLRGLSLRYGYLMQLWMDQSADGDGPGTLVAFGHSGSDGTHAWAFPEQDAMAFYFTQSRGSTTGLQIEAVLSEALLGAPASDDRPAAEHGPLTDYIGYYRRSPTSRYRAIVLDGDRLALEAAGKRIVHLDHRSGDRWSPALEHNLTIEFARSGDGRVERMVIAGQPHDRFEPANDLPTPDELIAKAVPKYGLDALAELGPMEIRSEYAIPRLKLAGSNTTVLAWPDRFVSRSEFGATSESTSYDGHVARYASSATPAVELEGEALAATRNQSWLTTFGDWRRWYDHLEVVQRIPHSSGDVFLVRTGDASGPADTIFVNGDGKVFQVRGMTHAEGIGRIGRRIAFGDFREVSGMLLPHEIRVEMANPMLGMIEIEIRVQEIRTGVELDDDDFLLQ